MPRKKKGASGLVTVTEDVFAPMRIFGNVLKRRIVRRALTSVARLYVNETKAGYKALGHDTIAATIGSTPARTKGDSTFVLIGARTDRHGWQLFHLFEQGTVERTQAKTGRRTGKIEAELVLGTAMKTEKAKATKVFAERVMEQSENVKTGKGKAGRKKRGKRAKVKI